MDTGSTITHFFIQLVIICNIYHTTPENNVCSTYLVSGLYGVEDAALTASSTYHSNTTHGPHNARLYSDSLHMYTEGSWSAASSNDQQYIQVKFPREISVDAILTQGNKVLNQWVETYYLLYSMDGTTWTTVTSQNHQPKLFNGNSDRYGVSKTDLKPKVTAVYLRINPRSWHKSISLRFDVSGCYKANKKRSQSTFFRLPTPPSASLQYYLMDEAVSSTYPTCSTMCHSEKSCFSFTFDVNKKQCRGYGTVIFGNHESFTHEPAVYYFVQNVADPSLGFRPIPTAIFQYKVNEVSLDQHKAFDLCISYQSRLIRIASKSKMEYLQKTIAANTILRKHHNQLLVSGMYVGPLWKYNDGSEVINSALWSPGNPNVTQGHCVILTQTGLASVDCAEKLFSICESF